MRLRSLCASIGTDISGTPICHEMVEDVGEIEFSNRFPAHVVRCGVRNWTKSSGLLDAAWSVGILPHI
jgi:hypothetical protein